MTVLTAMGGLLTRHPDGWRWRDGRAEPRVRDLLATEAYPYPRVVHPHPDLPGGRLRYVAVPRSAVAGEPDLAEVVSLAGGRARRPTGESVVEVPEDVWEAWARDRVIGLLWDAADEEALLATAKSLGETQLR